MAVIDVHDLRKTYHGRAVVDGVTFSVEEGEIFGVLGPNGAGKTTTVECLSGLRTPDAGDLRVLGLDPRRDGAELRQRLGVQLQSAVLPDRLKVGEALDLYASFYREPADWTALLERVGLADRRDTPFGKLSGGQKQRVSIALALVGDPRVAILDELTTGLDPQARRDTWGLIEDVRAMGVTIVLVTHFMEEAERLCDRLALIDAGRLVALDTPSGLVRRVGKEQRLRFRPAEGGTGDEEMAAALRSLPEVTGVTRADGEVVVTGTASADGGSGGLVLAVSTTLAARRIVPLDLRIERVTLDDAFLALTGKKIDS
ncbi:ABC transporter ATP-binding protein [Spongiactinospora sp. TRM90649]|uniref:ABC transporter ATP-binding protein n=1 Tax=Spongiactinospora sp. TRM90649 TaxID=3031114 RepID=UPI0023F7E33B|nr:ABC transporter ATP-binding protein [Spongiactinospora sp. TRM90649]MDF5756101.1 ABC transporter ATP-binding protein [Spongiactinospora sp. TRM90649]